MDLYGQGEPNKKSANIEHDAQNAQMEESDSDDVIAIGECGRE